MQHHAKKIVWIATIILGVALCSMSAAGAVGGDNIVSQAESTEVTVNPNESIQDAIDRADAGETVIIPEGIYEENLEVDKELTVLGEGEVILDGNSLDEVNGITVTAADTTIKNITIRRFGSTGISISGSDALTRDIVIENVTSRLNDGSGLSVTAATDASQLEVTSSRFTQNNVYGVNTDGKFDSVKFTQVEVKDNYDTGLNLRSVVVTLRDAVVTENNGEAETFEDEPQHGIDISEAEDVLIEDSTFRDNRGNNILIDEGSDNQPLTRNVDITNVTATRTLEFDGGGYTGIAINSATEDDVINVTNVSVRGSKFKGISLNAEEVTVEGIRSYNNNDIGLDITGTTVAVRNARVTGNDGEASTFEDEAQHGIAISEAEDVLIEDSLSQDNRGNNVRIEEESENQPLTRSVNITNVTATRTLEFDGSRYTGVYVDSATENDKINVTNVSVQRSGYKGLSLNADEINISDVESHNNEDIGIDITGTTVAVHEVRATENNGEASIFEDEAQHGIDISEAEDVLIGDSLFRDNRGNNIRIDEESENQPLNRNVNITNVTATRTVEFDGEKYTGISIGNAVEEDTINLTNVTSKSSAFNGISLNAMNINVNKVEVTDNSNNGLNLAGTDMSIRNSNISGNTEIGIRFESVRNRATVRNSSITGSSLLVDNDAETEVDAQMNWWGNPNGPEDEEIEGSVDVSQPFSSPSNDQSDNDDGENDDNNNNDEENNSNNTDVPSGLAETLSEEQFEAIDNNNDGIPQLGELVTANLERINNDGMIQTPNGEAVEIGLNELVTTNIWRINNA